MIKNSQQTWNIEAFLILLKNIDKKSTVSITLNGEKPDAILLRLGVR